MQQRKRPDPTLRHRFSTMLAAARRLQLQHARRGEVRASARYARLSSALRRTLAGMSRRVSPLVSPSLAGVAV